MQHNITFWKFIIPGQHQLQNKLCKGNGKERQNHVKKIKYEKLLSTNSSV